MMKDEFSGEVAWDEDSRMPGGTITLAGGRTCKFSIDVDETDEAVSAAARNTLKYLIANEPLIRHTVAASTIKCYQDTWFDEDPITPDELAQKIHLHDVEIYDEGVELYYTSDEKGFLGGHWIQVPIDANGEMGEPQIEG